MPLVCKTVNNLELMINSKNACRFIADLLHYISAADKLAEH